MSKNGRINIAIGLAGCDFGESGIGVFAKALIPRLVRVLANKGARTFLIGTQRERQGLEVNDFDGVKMPSVLDHPGASAAFSWMALSAIARLWGADALYLPAANRRTVGWSVVPTIGTVHDLAQFHVSNKYGIARQLYIQRVLTPSLRRLQLVTTVSQATARDVEKFARVGSNKIRVVPNGVTLADSDGHQARARPYLLYPARLEHPGKNHLRLIEGFVRSSAYSSHDLILAGADWGARAAIEHAIARHSAADRVYLTGFVSREELTSLLRSADAVVVAGLFEGFGLPAAEGLTLGKPIVASNTGSMPEVVGDLGLFFDPMDVESIASALGRVIEDWVLKERCREEGPARAERFSWDRAAGEIGRMLLEVAHAAA